jgi:hypothetical protein
MPNVADVTATYVNDGSVPFFYDSADIPTHSPGDVVDQLPPEVDIDEFFARYGHSLKSKTVLSSPTLSVFKVSVGPGEAVKPHHHNTNQLVYILSGSLSYGRRVVTEGMGFFNAGRKYSWQAGEEGATFLEIHAGIPALMA